MAACEALRKFGIYEGVTEYIKTLPATVTQIFKFLIDEWSKEYTKQFVQDVTGVICASKDGLSENQINDILTFQETKTGEAYEANFSRIYDSLASFLAAGGGGYLRFFHDQLKYTVRNEFMNDEVEQKIHKLLADFFLSVIETQYREIPNEDPMAYYHHSLNQLVYHQLRSRIEQACN